MVLVYVVVVFCYYLLCSEGGSWFKVFEMGFVCGGGVFAAGGVYLIYGFRDCKYYILYLFLFCYLL